MTAVTLKSSDETEKLTGGWRKLVTPDTKIRANHRMLKLRESVEAIKISIQLEAKPARLSQQIVMASNNHYKVEQIALSGDCGNESHATTVGTSEQSER